MPFLTKKNHFLTFEENLAAMWVNVSQKKRAYYMNSYIKDVFYSNLLSNE